MREVFNGLLGARVVGPRARWCLALLACLCTAAPWRARAAGVEDAIAGGRGLGRAASFGRVRGFMAVLQNPANLARSADRSVGLELRLPALRACFDRARRPDVEYRQDDDGTLLEHFDRVCNDAAPLPTVNLGWARSFGSWGAGVGLFTPAAVGSARYGDDTIVSLYPAEDEPYRTTDSGLESPNRQLGIERRSLTAYFMAGLGAAPRRDLRFGLSAGLGLLRVYNQLTVSAIGGTFQDQEILTELTVTDWAIPRFTGSALWSPDPRLELFGVLQFHADADAKGRMVLTANGIQGAPLRACSSPTPGSHCYIDDVRVDVPFPPLEITFGLRFAQPRAPAAPPTGDPALDERFDVEVNVAWAQTSHVDALEVTIHDLDFDQPNAPRIQFGNGREAAQSYVRQGTAIPKNWMDTWTVRLGGDYNVLPGRLALRAGASFATRAVPIGTMNIDFWPVRKVGLHLGGTVAFGNYRLTAGYAHLFYQSVIVAPGEGEVKDISTLDEQDADAVNEGRYDATQDIFALQLDYRY